MKLPFDRARFFRLLFWSTVVFTGLCATLPAEQAPQISQSDKVEHFIAFFTLGLTAALAFPRALGRSSFWLCGFGGLIELAQAIPSLHRDSDVWDWITDTLAIAVVMLPLWIARRGKTIGGRA